MIIYRQATLDERTVEQLIALSKEWVEEDICHGMVTNTRDDLKEPCFIALEGEIIVGYIFGHYYEKETRNSSIAVGSKCFDIDELYIKKEYRNQGIGSTLFKMMEEEVKGKCEFITLATSSKDYQKVLHFYCEENMMDFFSAYLIKKI